MVSFLSLTCIETALFGIVSFIFLSFVVHCFEKKDYICSVFSKELHKDIGSYITESPPRRQTSHATNAIRASRHVRRRFYDAFEVCGEPW